MMPITKQLGILCGALLAGCVVPPSSKPAAGPQASSILAASKPSPGATVAGSLNSLELHFNPPARLDEVTVSGPAGTMPTMVHAVGEVADYSLPLPGLGPGDYMVAWRASSGGHEYHGSFGFTVKQ